MPSSFANSSHRNYRAYLSSASVKPSETLRSLKFPLNVTQTPSWQNVFATHQIINCDEHGSLLHVIKTALTHGFRFFSKISATESFVNAIHLKDKHFITESDLTIARDFTPSKIYQRILFKPRSVNGKSTGFNIPTLELEYTKFFCSGKSGDKIPPPEQTLFSAIAHALVNHFKSWDDLADHPVHAGKVIDDVLNQLGYSYHPSLAERFAKIEPLAIEGTVAYEPDAITFGECQAEYVYHLIVARALHSARAEGITEAKPSITYAQEFFTGDANHGGLAWAFGKGFTDYFSIVSRETLAKDFNAPLNHAEALLKAYQALPKAETTLLSGKNYANYRSSIGGILSSWTANYVARLFELEAVLSQPVDNFTFPQALLDDADFLNKIGTSATNLNHLLERAIQDRKNALQALQRLKGDFTLDIVSERDVEVIENYSAVLSTLDGLMKQLLNQIKQQIEFATKDKDVTAQAHLTAYLFTQPSWIKALNKVNRLKLASINIHTELDGFLKKFVALREAMFIHFASILAYAQSHDLDLNPFIKQTLIEEQHLPKNSKINPQVQAYRCLIDRLIRSARKVSEETKQQLKTFWKQEPVFAHESQLNKYLFNNQGTLYISSFNKDKRQSPYPLHVDAAAQQDTTLAHYGEWLKEFRHKVFNQQPLTHRLITDLFLLEQAYFGVILNGIPHELPSSLATNDALRDYMNIPVAIQLELQATTVGSSTVRRIFNLYYSDLHHLASVLLREQFYLRANFQRAGEFNLFYVPKNQAWTPPSHYYHDNKMELLLHGFEAQTQNRTIDAPLALASLTNNEEKMDTSIIRHYLTQAPHDWYFEWQGGAIAQGISVGKQGIANKLIKTKASRLIGNSTYKGILNKMLNHPELVSVGDISIQFDQIFNQSLVYHTDGTFKINIQEAKQIISVTLPTKETLPERNAFPFTHYVAIDLNEYYLGYAVFDFNHQLVAQDKVRVKSMTAYAQDAKQGKRTTSKVNKFRCNFDPAQLRRRDNVVGDIQNAINRLMWYYKAFPVLESTAGGNGKDIDAVFEQVIANYLYSNIKTVNTARENYWLGANYWQHPTFQVYKWDEVTGKRGTKVGPLNLFPGTGVSSYGTSQTCSCCGRNPIEVLHEARKNGQKEFKVNPNSTITLTNGTIKVFFSAKNEERMSYLRKNQRNQLTLLPEQSIIKLDDLLAGARRNLRQAPIDKRVMNSKNSTYHCLYTDCGAIMNAEINSAINIGKKFQQQLLQT